MGFEEKLFAFGYRFFKRLHAEPPPPYFAQRAELRSLDTRLLMLSQTLTGRSVHVVQAEGGGGFSGDHFYFPKHICLFSEKILNERIYLHRTIFYCLALEEGLCLPSSQLSEVEIQMYSCLATYWIYKKYIQEFSVWFDEAVDLQHKAYNELFQNEHAIAQTDDYLQNTVLNQNQIIIEWLKQILRQDFAKGPWVEIDIFFEKGPQGFWEFGKYVFEKYLKEKPVGNSISEGKFILWGLLKENPESNSSLEDGAEEQADPQSLASGTELPGKNRETLTQVRLQDQNEDLNPVMHTFEKMETLEEYQGGLRIQDGDDNLQEHAEALEELNIREVIRSRERTHSIYKAEIQMNSQAPQLEQQGDSDTNLHVIEYPEWDFKSKSYRPNWCSLEIQQASKGIESFKLSTSYQRELREVKKLFAQLRAQPQWSKRQREGEEFDLEAMVDRFATLQSGHCAEDRLYLRRKTHHKDWQCVILLDVSLSTDSWVDNERVLDVIKNSVGLMAEALTNEEAAVSVAAFHSNTRHHCSYRTLKEFADPWAHLKKTLLSLEPAGYTRIGPALRHAASILNQSSARHKFVVLLTDGKASDYDQYEGRYGVEDIRMAVKESQQSGVQVKCLAVDQKAKFYLPQMFGQGQVRVIGSPTKLPGALRDLFAPLISKGS